MIAAVFVKIFSGTIHIITLKIVISFHPGGFCSEAQFSFHEILLIIRFDGINMDLRRRQHVINIAAEFYLPGSIIIIIRLELIIVEIVAATISIYYKTGPFWIIVIIIEID